MTDRHLLPLVVATIALSTPASAQDVFEVSDDATYTAVVYAAGADAAATVADALQGEPVPEGAEAQLLLQSLDGATLVELIRWETAEAAEAHRGPYFPSVQAYWQREYRLVTSFAQEGEGFEIGPGSAVQWSEFLMRDPELLPELSETVTGMTEAMTMGGPETLLSIQQLHAENGMSIGLIGRWSEAEGFQVFEQDETFGDEPYWSDYADNAHWMTRVLSIR